MGLLGRLYRKVVISVDVDVQLCKVKVTHHKNAQHNEERSFRTVNGDLPIEAAKYIRHIQNGYPYTYIATMSRAKKQGLISGNKLRKFEAFGLNPNMLMIMLVNRKWFAYIDKDDMARFRSKFSKIHGVDFIFSPFCLIYEKIKPRLDGSKKLYILQEKGACSLMIADKSGVYYGSYIPFEQNNLEIKEGLESSDDDVVKFEAIGEINENIIIKDFDSKSEEELQKNNLTDLSTANTMITIIKEALNTFYRDERYASDFIEELLILDASGISDSSITHLTNNIMLETQFLRVDVCTEIERLAKMELRIKV